LAKLSGRRALDVACGDGRNAGYLASELGFEVDALDVSDVAIEALGVAAAARGLAVNAMAVDLEQRGFPAGPYDAIVQINYLQRNLFGPLAGALAPGGLLILETFTRSDLETLGNHVESRFLLEVGELPVAFAELEILRHREAVVEHRGRARAVAGLVARRAAVGADEAAGRRG
jgi:2-polyprenyl-3-methyl-5-hydroxy-6-metoxy-1,4-benzoquinol methylase